MICLNKLLLRGLLISSFIITPVIIRDISALEPSTGPKARRLQRVKERQALDQRSRNLIRQSKGKVSRATLRPDKSR